MDREFNYLDIKIGGDIIKTYETKLELIKKIEKTAKLFIDEFKIIEEENKEILVDGVDKTPMQMIAYQLGWLNLILQWDSHEKNGEKVITPTEKYKWNKLGELYKDFYNQYSSYSLKELIELFENRVVLFIKWIDSLSDEELYKQDKRKWASSTPSRWPIWKWIHINTVAPFKNFRSKIRKWKKISSFQINE